MERVTLNVVQKQPSRLFNLITRPHLGDELVKVTDVQLLRQHVPLDSGTLDLAKVRTLWYWNYQELDMKAAADKVSLIP